MQSTRWKWMMLLSLVALAATAVDSAAKVVLAPPFADNAVLQRQMAVPVWGSAKPGDTVTVEFAGQKVTTKAAADGKWMLKLSPLETNRENRKMVVSDSEGSVTVNDLLVGEVWLCSGQSNMEMPLWGPRANFRHRLPGFTGEQEANQFGNNPMIRFSRMVPYGWSRTPQSDFKMIWYSYTSETVKSLSGTGYFFGKLLQKELKDVPIGLITAHWGGTRIEPWTPPEGFDSVPEVSAIAERVNAKIAGSPTNRKLLQKVEEDTKKWLEAFKQGKAENLPLPPEFPSALKPFTNHQDPTVLYNHMIYPFVPYALRGAIWYQGCSNRNDGGSYRYKLQALLNGWRKVFQNPNMAFYLAQLAPFAYGGDPTLLPQICVAQESFADANGDNVQMAITNDAVHDIRDIHPADKQTVGVRLANLALKYTYGRKDIKADAPRISAVRAQGDALVFSFKNVEKWSATDGNFATGFEAAAVDGVFMPAKITLKGTDIEVRLPSGLLPQYVRYLWHQTKMGNLHNEAGIPMGCFNYGDKPDYDRLKSFYEKNSKLLYSFDLKTVVVGLDKMPRYDVDNSAKIGNVKRVTYFIQATPKSGEVQWMVISMDAFTRNAKLLGVPLVATGAQFQTRVRNMNVFTNVPGIRTGTLGEGNIEFWPHNYNELNSARIPNANGQEFDWGDNMREPRMGYGCMQIHDFNGLSVLFAFNNFARGGNADFGFGNNPSGKKDWTFSSGLSKYSSVKVQVYVTDEAPVDSAKTLEGLKKDFPEVANKQLVYVYNLLSGTDSSNTNVNYDLDATDKCPKEITGKRVAYLARLVKKGDKSAQWVYVEMDAFTNLATQLGVPAHAANIRHQKGVKNLKVRSNVPGVKNGEFANGNIEFWSSNYAQTNSAKVKGASDGSYDFGDSITENIPGYGSMQIHNTDEKQTIFAYNNFRKGAEADLGIGNCPGEHPDWTFSSAAKHLAEATLYILLEK